MKHSTIRLEPVPLADSDWQYVTKRSLEEYRAEDWAVSVQQRKSYLKQQQVNQVLRLLECQQDDPGYVYTVNNYYHCLQTATRMLKAGLAEEDVVVGLLHDVGFNTCNESHGEFAAVLLRPYISERNYWMLVRHAAVPAVSLSRARRMRSECKGAVAWAPLFRMDRGIRGEIRSGHDQLRRGNPAAGSL